MCSKCYREVCNTNTHKQEVAPEAPKEPMKTDDDVRPAVSSPMCVTCTPETSAIPKPQIQTEPTAMDATPEMKTPVEVAAAATPNDRPPQKRKNRCFTCNKKIGLTGFTCRCGYIFCSEHRYSDKHECTFDYKLAGRQSIEKANPKVVASKINKI